MTAKKLSVGELADLTGSDIFGDPTHLISGVESLETASTSDASFLANPRYHEAMLKSKAGVICIARNSKPVDGKNFLLCDNPSLTFQKIIEFFISSDLLESGFLGVHPTAVVHATAKIGQNVSIGPYAVIDKGVIIGDNTKISAHVYVGSGTTIGKNCHLHPHAVVRELCHLGDRVILQPGAVIGSCGFGYTTDAKGDHTKLEQLGSVVLQDDVEIGANTTIDRARFSKTLISKGSKIDNLVQIGHNVQVGPNNIIISQSGLAGSVKTGRNVVLGGQAGAVGHIEIADYVMIATRGGISKSMTKPGKYAGSPVMPIEDYNRQQVQLRKISEYIQQIQELSKEVETLKKAFSEISSK